MMSSLLIIFYNNCVIIHISHNNLRNLLIFPSKTIYPSPLITPAKVGAVYYLRDKAVKIGISGALDVKGSPANVIDSLIVKKHSDISVLEEGMCRKDAVVRLYNGCGDLW